MKKTLLSICLALTIATAINAQVPMGIKYQAIARNATGAILANENVVVGIKIISENNDTVYSIDTTVNSNVFGLIDLVIGENKPASFAKIDWSAGEYIFSVQLDGRNMGTSQILSVPYALHAKNADNGITTEQANEIAANTAKVGITTEQANEIVANTAKVGITTAQANAIVANTAKVGITTGTQTIAGTKTFSSPVNVATPTASTNAATKAYVDDLSIPVKSGTISLGTAQQIFTIGTNEIWLVSVVVPYSAPATDNRQGTWIVYNRSNNYSSGSTPITTFYSITATGATMTVTNPDQVFLNVNTGNSATNAEWSAIRLK